MRADTARQLELLDGRNRTIEAQAQEILDLKFRVIELRAVCAHVQSMASDAYLIDHPEWVEIVAQAQDALDSTAKVAP